MLLRYFLILLFLAIGVPAHALEISFLPKADVSDKFITLGDIVEFDTDDDLTRALADQVISKSPEPGEQKFLRSADIIKNIIRKTTLSRSTLWSGSATVKVFRQGVRIVPKMIENEIGIYLKNNKNQLPDADIRFVSGAMPLPFSVPKGDLTWEIIPSSPSIIDSTRFAVIIRVDGRVRENLSIPGKIEAIASTVAATTPLERGAIITPDNIHLVRTDITELKNPCLDLRSILGKRLTRSVRAGNVINTSDVEFPAIVQKGQLVKIFIRQRRLVLTATGIANMDGKLNEVIRVRNASSNKLIYCKVTAPGIVEVII
ncbi:flagellar basal body P-ring formation chaperone FlgA [Desulfopila inferna]|uniref:flagellar basal body P-ring formation chaperone FlgA n=1 Tax=Desulfopila inferna TaxID=468528 RepID=UPI001965FECD|nr:flagellar basal body P-ring formation chaperone FlgA [Desulfopila inferna]MBM9602995.1 flagellar basal body P-ring formation protein FlgA [Desulfopila inferna]